MAIAVYFHPKGLTLDKFQETHRRLSEAAQAEPEGRIHHSCFGEDGDLMVTTSGSLRKPFKRSGRH
jgi:hypothetical protein